MDKKQRHKRRVLTEEKLDDKGARLKHTPRKSLKHQLKRLECQSNTVILPFLWKLV
jgi:hypothetical protein